MNFKLVISDPKKRKAYQKDIPQSDSGLIGRKIGDIVDGSSLGFEGYKFQITGGSDKDGFPMRFDLDGVVRKKLLLASGPGFKPRKKGERRRKMIRGNTIAEDIVQINMKIVEYGKKDIEEILGLKKEVKETENKNEGKSES